MLTAATCLAGAGAVLPATAGQTAATGETATAADPTPAAPKKLFTIKDNRLEESSGLAKSAKHDGLYWTINDSGDSARVFGVDTTGEVQVVLRFNAQVRDVEAIAVDADGTIYVADIGDNNATRDMIEIYTIPEPETLKDAENVRYHRYDFKYPDGAHDAETLLVQPQTNRLFIVTKTTKKTPAIYAAPRSPSRQGTNELTKYASAPKGQYTDGTFLPDGERIVLRSYTDVSTLSWGTTPALVARGPVPLAQGESVAVGAADNTLLVGSEGANSIVYQVPVPAKAGTGSPPATATPKPTSGAPDSGATPAEKNHSLRWILIGAALFAIVVTALTFPPGRRERLDRMAENARLTGQPPTPTPTRRRHSA
nr:hypothetical protein [Kribbella sandramycini]